MVVEILSVKMNGQTHLLAVVHAKNALRFGLGLGERGQEHPGKNGNNCDHNEEFNEREPTTSRRFGNGLKSSHNCLGKERSTVFSGHCQCYGQMGSGQVCVWSHRKGGVLSAGDLFGAPEWS